MRGTWMLNQTDNGMTATYRWMIAFEFIQFYPPDNKDEHKVTNWSYGKTINATQHDRITLNLWYRSSRSQLAYSTRAGQQQLPQAEFNLFQQPWTPQNPSLRHPSKKIAASNRPSHKISKGCTDATLQISIPTFPKLLCSRKRDGQRNYLSISA